MLRQKILRTALTVGSITGVAMALDYVVNVHVLHDYEAYAPLTTFLISIIISGPLAYWLTSQKLDLERLRDDLSASLAEKQVAIAEAENRRIQAEDALSRLGETDKLYRALAENLADNLALWSATGERLYTSPSIEKLTGYSVEEFLTLPADAGVSPEDFQRVLKAVRALEPGGAPAIIEYETARKDGAKIWIESTYSRVGDGSGMLISTSRDITERRKLQTDVARALQMAQTAAAAKSDFLANMTHELRTPLTAIIGFAEVLKRSRGLTRKDARHVGLILDASNTLLSVVNDVLDFSRLEAGGVQLDPQPFRPCALVNSAAALVQAQAEAKGLTLKVVAPKTPEPMLADGPRLSQVVLNFLSNAVKFTEAGRVTLSLEQRVEGNEALLRVEVADTGIGIAPDNLDGVFDRFSQADAAVSRRFGGTGLGLAISRRIVERMGGEIGVDSVEGEGSRFWFQIRAPLATMPEDIVPEAVEALDGDAVRLLVVEDNAVNRELLRVMLEPFGIGVETANDGEAGVQAVRDGRYDLVLMDIQMPVMDGLTATREIRAFEDETGGRTPIVAMTANVLPEQVATCLAAGMDDHLGKPINPAKLLETVARWSGRAA